MSTVYHRLEPEVTEVRRLEVITGTGRRRQFTADFKARVIEETLVPGAVVSAVARRHGLSPQQVFTWRRQAWMSTSSKAPQFVPAIVETALPSRPARKRQRRRTHRVDWTAAGSIEVEIEGVTVRVGCGTDAKTIAAVLRALKAGA